MWFNPQKAGCACGKLNIRFPCGVLDTRISPGRAETRYRGVPVLRIHGAMSASVFEALHRGFSHFGFSLLFHVQDRSCLFKSEEFKAKRLFSTSECPNLGKSALLGELSR